MAPHSSTSSSELRRMVHGVRLTLAVVVLVECALAFVPENTMIRTFRWMKALITAQPAPDIQLHGDSVAQGGLLAGEVLSQLPESTRVFNAAMQGTGPEFTYYLLQRQIRSGRVPRAIVLAHSPHTYVTERMGILAGAFLDVRDLPDALLRGEHFFDTLYGVLCRLSFTLRHREEIESVVKGKRRALAEWNEPLPTAEFVLEDLASDTTTPEQRREAVHSPVHAVFRRPFAPDPGERRYLARTLALARSRGITVYWFTMPEHPAVAAIRDSTGFTRDYGRFVDSLAAAGEVVPLELTHPVWPAEDFADHSHLVFESSQRVSRELGRLLAAPGYR